MKIGVLGSMGMLGQAVCRYFDQKSIPYARFDNRFSVSSARQYIQFLEDHSFDFVINCIGSIPHKNSYADDYFSLNIALPYYLNRLKNTVLIHPSTDCVFNHNLKEDGAYPKSSSQFDAVDVYGFSKGVGDFFIREGRSVVVRSSIIGLTSKSNSKGLVDWAFSMRELPIIGFKNHYWNGVTTDAWAHWVYQNIIFQPHVRNSIVHIGSSDWTSKSDLLHSLNEIFDLNLSIRDICTDNASDRRLSPDYEVASVYQMLCDMREFWHE